MVLIAEEVATSRGIMSFLSITTACSSSTRFCCRCLLFLHTLLRLLHRLLLHFLLLLGLQLFLLLDGARDFSHTSRGFHGRTFPCVTHHQRAICCLLWRHIITCWIILALSIFIVTASFPDTVALLSDQACHKVELTVMVHYLRYPTQTTKLGHTTITGVVNHQASVVAN